MMWTRARRGVGRRLIGWFAAGLLGAAPIAMAQSAAAPAQASSTDVPVPTQAPASPVRPASEAAPAHAATAVVDDGPKLRIGLRAPVLAPSAWIKGEPIKAFEAGKVYVVEFWATWCPPCVRSIPHLTELQATYKDRGVTIVGVATSERKGVDHLKKFVELRGDAMNYTVAFDDAGDSAEAWMEAAEQDGIPTAFVVDQQGRIAWIGQPMELGSVLAEIVAGTYDVDRVARDRARRRELDKLGEPIVQAAGEAYQAGDKAKVIEHLDKLIALDPPLQGRFVYERVAFELTESKEYDSAYRYAREAMTSSIKDDAVILNAIAWTIVDDERIEKRDIPLARQLAERAADITKNADAMVLDTLGKTQYSSGELAIAVKTQERAVELAPAGEIKDEMTKRLEKYRAEQQAATKGG
jgi:thiol-disulfide isomerase/thioredoxin